jgi:hypothetical protein
MPVLEVQRITRREDPDLPAVEIAERLSASANAAASWGGRDSLRQTTGEEPKARQD